MAFSEYMNFKFFFNQYYFLIPANIFYRKIRPKTTVELSLENNRITFPTDLRDFQSFLASPDTEGQKRGEQPPLTAEATWSTYRFCNGRDDFRCTLEILMTFLISILALQVGKLKASKINEQYNSRVFLLRQLLHQKFIK